MSRQSPFTVLLDFWTRSPSFASPVPSLRALPGYFISKTFIIKKGDPLYDPNGCGRTQVPILRATRGRLRTTGLGPRRMAHATLFPTRTVFPVRFSSGPWPREPAGAFFGPEDLRLRSGPWVILPAPISPPRPVFGNFIPGPSWRQDQRVEVEPETQTTPQEQRTSWPASYLRGSAKGCEHVDYVGFRYGHLHEPVEGFAKRTKVRLKDFLGFHQAELQTDHLF